MQNLEAQMQKKKEHIVDPFNMQKVTILGHGAVGSALCDEWSSRGLLYSVWDPKPERCVPPAYSSSSMPVRPSSKEHSKDSSHEPVRCEPESPEDLGDWIFLAVRDSAIPSAVDQLTRIPCDWSHKTVVHLSGSFGLTPLQPLANQGASIASMHPLQTFTYPSGRESLDTIFYSLMGDKAVTSTLQTWIREKHGTYKMVTEEQKQLLHLAAVFASNYMVSLFHVVELILDNKIPLSALEPIVRTTLENILKNGPSRSLSGPVQRGDVDTIQRHLGQLKNDTARLRMYKQLGLEALDIAEQQEGSTDSERQNRLKELRKLLEADY